MRRSIGLLAAVLSMAHVSAARASAPPPELVIEKNATPEPVTPGNLLTYTITALNDDGQSALNLTITDPLPAEIVFVSAVASPGATLTTPAVGTNGTVEAVWDAAGGTAMGLTPVGVSRTLTVIGRVCPETGCVDIFDTATVSAENAEDDASDKEESETTPASNMSRSKP